MDIMRESLLVITTMMVVSFCQTVAAETLPERPERSIDTPRHALEVAYAYTGFDEMKALITASDYSDVSVITFRDSTIPFLIDRVYNNRVWRIALNGVNLDMSGCPAEEEEKWNPKRFFIIIDSADGFFVKAFTEYHGVFDPYLGSEASAESAERQLRGDEIFLDFCGAPPRISMHQAISAAPGSDPLASKELSILLVRQMRKGKETTLWHIMGRGFPPEPFRSTGEVIPTNNHARTAVNAESGKALYRTPTPHPDRVVRAGD